MEKQSMCRHSNVSRLSLKDSDLVNSVINTGENQTLDLQKLSTRIICSANITRQNLKQKLSTPDASDDEDEFFQKLKSEIDKDLRVCSKENYKANDSCKIDSLSRKKRPIFDEESLNVIKRFKMDRNCKTVMQTFGNINSMQSTCFASNGSKEMCNESTSKISENPVRQESLFTYNALNMNFRSPSNKYVFEMSSNKPNNNVLPLHIKKTNFIHTEYEEFLLYEFLTPPDNSRNDIMNIFEV